MKSDPTLDLMDMLLKVSRQMKAEMSYSSDIVHLSVLQIQTLFFINQNGQVSMSDVAAHFRIELPSATSLINKLCDQKFTIRFEGELDRRLVMVKLTNDGKILLEQAISERQKKLAKTLSFLSASEKSSLLTILQTLNSRLQLKNEN